jgi:hypothetical protein
MPQFKNLGFGSLTIQLSDDKQITLGPRETKDVSADESKSVGVYKALRDGLIAVLPGNTPVEKSKKANIN